MSDPSVVEPLAAGAAAPDFELDATGGGRVRLTAVLAEGPVALYFYPGDFTPG
jgi:thioredoxin-dependent peroxiredoxin